MSHSSTSYIRSLDIGLQFCSEPDELVSSRHRWGGYIAGDGEERKVGCWARREEKWARTHSFVTHVSLAQSSSWTVPPVYVSDWTCPMKRALFWSQTEYIVLQRAQSNSVLFTVTAFTSTDFTSFRLYHPAPFAVWLVVRSPNPVSGDFPAVRETNQTAVRTNAIIYTVIQFIHIQGEQREAHLREASL